MNTTRASALNMASWSAGAIAMLIMLMTTKFFPSPLNIVIPAGLMMPAIFFFTVGAARSWGPRDALYIGRATVKFLAGIGLLYLMKKVANPDAAIWLKVAAVWFLVTGGTRLFLLFRGFKYLVAASMAMERQDAHGKAEFTSAEELLERMRR